MSTGIYPNFLSENALRPYPFKDHELMGSSVPLSFFLDAKGYSKSPNVGKIGITKIHKDDSGNTIVRFVSFHEATETEPLDIRIPAWLTEDNDAQQVHGSIKDEAGTDFIYISLLAHRSIESIPEMDTSASPIFLEPSVVVDLYKKSVHHLSIKDIKHKDHIKSKHVRFVGGHNVITRLDKDSKSLYIEACEGCGEGKDVYPGFDNNYCIGVLGINGISPDKNGKFKLEGGDCVIVKDIPERHAIQIYIDPDCPLRDCTGWGVDEAP